jgi:hypothetical protein
MAFDPISTVLDIGGKILDRVIPDTNARQQAKDELAKAINDQDFQLTMAQIQVNLEEAKSDSLFKSGWRPATAWVCATAFALHFVLLPIGNIFVVAFGHPAIIIPFDMATLLTVLGGLLGLGTLRSIDKIKGVA